MDTINISFEVPKESKEIIDALMEVYDFVKAGKGLTDAAELFDDLATAMGGVDQVKAELESEYKDELMAYAVKELGSRLFKKADPVDAPPAE